MNDFNSAKSLIEKSQNILILPAAESQGDEWGAGFGLFLTLRKMGKNVNLPADKMPEKFQFLNNLESMGSKDFAISINTQNKEISEMRYEKAGDALKIYLTLDKGKISPKDVLFNSTPSQNPDLLITLGASSLENVGEAFAKDPQLFYQTPVLNIDNRPENEYFGNVNLVEANSSLSEIIINLFQLANSKEGLSNKDISASLLTGLVWFYQNFRSAKAKPETFQLAACLIQQGADHQKIVQHLYKQKGVYQMRLLGKILENLEFHQEKEVYLSSLKEKDFQEAGASSKDLVPVMEEIKFNFKYLPNLLVLWESHASPMTVKGLIYSPHGRLIEKLLSSFEGASKREGALFLTREVDLAAAKEKVLKALN